ncbi:erythromycin esterase [Nocardia donostiensis]|uniref:erythromycin esterase family protein n=1 Tax=Nocardia donostiensis TaxID=1538463 RepID=UPI0009DA2075|nr:erythromycin esterase family protein [Nocardia donostiensis]OQS13039.1 erythromycin esterase [Nocardia donostiensis]
MARSVFRDRNDAGRVLARLLTRYRDDPDVVVLALPRGGVPVAYEVAEALAAPLDVLVVRKLGSPANPELALGAIASGGVLVTNDDVLRSEDVDAEVLERVTRIEERELHRREREYRGERPMVDIAGRTVIVVDDGLATGATMHAAVRALRRLGPARLVVAVPAAPQSSCEELAEQVDEVVCATTPSPFYAVGNSYWDFDQTTDEQVRELLARSAAHPEDTMASPDPHAAIRQVLIPVSDGTPPDDVLLDLVGDARLVLIGEASHGTTEFYAARANMTRKLIEQKGFSAVAVEADWPDAYRVNRFVRGQGTDTDAEQALRDFERFPTWMWRNTVVRDFVAWLRQHNARSRAEQIGFYGLDLYSMRRSAGEVISYLESVDPDAARRARDRYACFDRHADEQRYGYAAAFGAGESCEDQVVAQLVEMQRLTTEHLATDDSADPDERFYAEQNAHLVSDAEEYYRMMFGTRVSTWNLRDQHMFRTLIALSRHLEQRLGRMAKIVVWAHNSHLGDARATEMGAAGELNLGQLVRQSHPTASRLIGFSTHTGTVTAAEAWDGPARTMRVQPSLDGSVENLLHGIDRDQFLLRFDTDTTPEALRSALLERAIGVVYRPQSERRSHYFHTRPADQFDALIHIDETTALPPLDRISHRGPAEPGETYPYAV